MRISVEVEIDVGKMNGMNELRSNSYIKFMFSTANYDVINSQFEHC